jgi:hypothetical protein
MSAIRASSLATAPLRNTPPSAGRPTLAQWCAPGVGDAEGKRIVNNWEDPSENAEHTREKQQAAERAVECVESGMVVGLGAGSTAILAIRRIGQLLREGRLRDIVGVPCSSAIEAEARALGIPITLDPHGAVDLTIDGADEVDPELNLIKGGGERCYTRKSWPRPVFGRSSSSTRVNCRRCLAPTGRCQSRSSHLGALPEALPRIPGASRHRATAT